MKFIDSLSIQVNIIKLLKSYGELDYQDIAKKLDTDTIAVFDECDWLSELEPPMIVQVGYRPKGIHGRWAKPAFGPVQIYKIASEI